jgi:hypothetical protein
VKFANAMVSSSRDQLSKSLTTMPEEGQTEERQDQAGGYADEKERVVSLVHGSMLLQTQYKTKSPG